VPALRYVWPLDAARAPVQPEQPGPWRRRARHRLRGGRGLLGRLSARSDALDGGRQPALLLGSQQPAQLGPLDGSELELVVTALEGSGEGGDLEIMALEIAIAPRSSAMSAAVCAGGSGG
jgi:hypothetical protein